MADLESLSFALLIPFCICFVLVFLVCCFAEQVKTLFRFPSQILTNYIAVTPQRRQRNMSRGRHTTTPSYLDMEETRILIRNQEERPRTSSESSNDSGPSYVTVIPSFAPLVLHQGQIICPQTVLNNGQLVQYPTQIVPHTVILAPSTNFGPNAHAHNLSPSSSTSLVKSNSFDKLSLSRTVCSLPSITENVEIKNEKSTSNFTSDNDVIIESREQRRPIRNLPEVISPNLLSEKK